MTKTIFPVPRFQLGQIVATPGALDACSPQLITRCLARHASCDWGCIDAEDIETNDDAFRHGGRLLSAYPIDEEKPSIGWGENTLWIITEADRSVTTLLLPDEY